MPVEYALARLAGLRSQFPTFATLEKMASGREGAAMARALAGTVFEPEILNLSARKDLNITIPLVLRLVNEGSVRIRRLFAFRAAQAWPERRDFFVARWEMEEIKAALRYLSFGGAGLEKRFGFVSYILGPGLRVWNAHMKPAEFLSALRKARHPLSSLVGAAEFTKDPVAAEITMERRFFSMLLGSPERELCPACREYFTDQLDMINAKNAWLLRSASRERRLRPELFIAAGGRMRLEDFLAIGAAPQEREAVARIQEKLKMRLDPEKLDSPYGISTAIRNAMLKKYRRLYLQNPGGVWAFLCFAEELDGMIADVSNAIYCGATCSTVDVVSRRFIGAKA